MQLPPQSVIDSWPPGSFEHPTEQRGLGLTIMFGIFLPVMVAVIAARSYARIHIVKDFGLDDAFILAAAVPAIAIACTTTYSTYELGWRVHVWDIATRPDLVTKGLRLILVTEILFSLSVAFTKISMLLFVRKIVGPTMPKLLLATNVTLCAVVVQNLIFVSINTFTCRPVSEFWTLSVKPQNCFNETAHLLAAGCINIVTDVLVVLLPIPLTLTLKIPPKQKISLILLFGSGFVVCIAGILRTYYTYQFTTAYDKTWTAYPLLITLVIEIYLGIITASLPGIKPLLPHRASHLFNPLPKRKNSEPCIDTMNLDIPRSNSRSGLIPDAKHDIDLQDYSLTYNSDRFSYLRDLKRSSPTRQYQEILPRPSCHVRPEVLDQTDSKPATPSRPAGLVSKRPSFYTAMYGSTKGDQETCSVGTRRLAKETITGTSQAGIETNHQFVDQGDDSRRDIHDPNPFSHEVNPASYCPRTNIYSPYSRTMNSLSCAEQKELASHRPVSIWPTWNPGAEAIRNAKFTVDGQAASRRESMVGPTDERILIQTLHTL